MADSDDRERTESPTQKRLDDARAKGQVPRSRDLNAAAVVLTGGLGLFSLGSAMSGRLMSVMRAGLSFRGAEAFDGGQMLLRLEHAALQGGLAAAPLLGLLLAAAILAPLAIGGWTFSSQALVPDFTRLNPIAGLRRVFSVRGLIELGKALARVILVALPAVIVLIDVPLALWQFNQSMRMSRQEIREENKESDGNPEIKSRVKRVQQAMARKRMMQEVPKADVVITNPTHYAVALRYDDVRMRAPVVVAKGQDLIAARIRELALEHKVAIVEAPPLARALHAHCELGDPIPARLYAAVAKVLTYVYQLRTVRRHGGAAPPPPTVELPEE